MESHAPVWHPVIPSSGYLRNQGFIHGFEQNNMAQNLLNKSFKAYLQFGLDHVNQSLQGLVDTLALQSGNFSPDIQSHNRDYILRFSVNLLR